MKWDCKSAPVSNVPGTEYLGHVLERAMEIIDGESRTPWVGWRCVHCGDRFALPGEVDRYDLPLMERVETEELPTEAREIAAMALGCVASTPGLLVKDVWLLEHGGLGLACAAIVGASLCGYGDDYVAAAESVIRNGEV